MHGFAVHCNSWNWKHSFQLSVEYSPAPHVVPLLFSRWSCRTLTCKASGGQRDCDTVPETHSSFPSDQGGLKLVPTPSAGAAPSPAPLQELVPVPDMPGLWWVVKIHGGAAAPAPGLISSPWRSSVAAAVPPCVLSARRSRSLKAPQRKEIIYP